MPADLLEPQLRPSFGGPCYRPPEGQLVVLGHKGYMPVHGHVNVPLSYGLR